MVRFQGHVFYIKHMSSMTLGTNFTTHSNLIDPRMTVHIMDYEKSPKDIPRSG